MTKGIVDIQTHYVPPKAAQLLADYRAQGGIVDGIGAIDPASPMCGLDARLRAMDSAGVAVSVLSFAPIGAVADDKLAKLMGRVANEGLLEACARHADRFVAAAMLPLPHAEVAESELLHIRSEGAVRAVQIVAQTTRYQPELPEFEVLYAMVANAGLPLLLHPAAGVADLSPHFDAYGLSSGMHAMVSHALVAARMMQSGLLDRVPGLELIMTHLGGILPFLIERLDERAQGPAARPPSQYLRDRVYLDGCGYPTGPLLRCAIETLGVERIMLGSDWPSRPIKPAIDAVRGLALDSASETAILRNTALRWFDPTRPRIAPVAHQTIPVEINR